MIERLIERLMAASEDIVHIADSERELCLEAACILQAQASVGIKQENIIMQQKKKIAALLTDAEKAAPRLTDAEIFNLLPDTDREVKLWQWIEFGRAVEAKVRGE